MFNESDDLFAPVPPPPPAVQNGVVLCEFDGLLLAIPQQDVTTIEHGSQLAAPLSGERVIGWFESDRGPWPVYALNKRLQLADDSPSQRAFLVFLRTETAPMGLLCESVRIVGKGDELKTQPLPEPLASHAPLGTGIALLANRRVALAFGIGVIAAHLQRLERANDALGDTVIKRDLGIRRGVMQKMDVAQPAKSPENVRAWLLDWRSQMLALALCEVIEVVDAPQIHVLPFGPVWCRAVLVWRERFVALAGADVEAAQHIVVTAYQEREGEALRYAAFAIDSTPRQITVNDGLDCDPPLGIFDGALRASFEFEERVVVVPELSALFANAAGAAAA